jgi:hypothetical protein
MGKLPSISVLFLIKGMYYNLLELKISSKTQTIPFALHNYWWGNLALVLPTTLHVCGITLHHLINVTPLRQSLDQQCKLFSDDLTDPLDNGLYLF